MATGSTILEQHQTAFEIIEPLFYLELTGGHPYLPQWTLERMPRNVNTNRHNLDKKNMSGRWTYKRYNSKGTFRCIRCIKKGVNDDEATWSSAYVTVIFRGYYGPDMDEFGDTWIGGWVQMKVFAQACKLCDQYVTCEFNTERAKILVKWLHRWIANTFHGFSFPNPRYHRKQDKKPHHMNRCEARERGWCKYCNG